MLSYGTNGEIYNALSQIVFRGPQWALCLEPKTNNRPNIFQHECPSICYKIRWVAVSRTAS